MLCAADLCGPIVNVVMLWQPIAQPTAKALRIRKALASGHLFGACPLLVHSAITTGCRPAGSSFSKALSRNRRPYGSLSHRPVFPQEASMSEKPTKDQEPGGVSPQAQAAPDPSVYGGTWGPGATPTSHNQPGSIASDPASAPRPAKRREDLTPSPAEAEAAHPPGDEEAALRQRREQRWDNEGGAASTRPGGG